MSAVLLGMGLAACSKTGTSTETSVSSTASSGATTQATTAGGSAASDITVTGCKQDSTDTTQVDVSGTIVNHSPVVSDYNFVVDVFNGSSPAGQADVNKNGVAPGLVESWSVSSTIPGSTSGSFHCRVRNLLRTPSHP